MLLRKVLFLIVLVSWISPAANANFSFLDDKRFIDPEELFTLGIIEQSKDTISIEGIIAPRHYVYRQSLKITDGNNNEVTLSLPQGENIHDEFFGDTEIYKNASININIPNAIQSPLTLHWQGCAEAGLCYPPQTIAIDIPEKTLNQTGNLSSTDFFGGTENESRPTNGVTQETTKTAKDTGNERPLEMLGEDQRNAQKLATLSPITGTLLFFGMGLLLAFTPCTLPMIPIISSLIVGSGASPKRAAALSFTYIFTMAMTYAAVGVTAGLAGSNLQATLQSPWLLSAFAGLFIILAASLFGFFELRLPAFIANKLDSAGRKKTGGSIAGAVSLGFISALLVGPCMTAPLAGALLFISQTGSVITGGLALFALGIGMGLPLLLIAFFGARILPKPGMWMNRVKIIFGFIMLAMAVLMLNRFLPASTALLLWGIYSLACSTGLWAYSQSMEGESPQQWTLRFVALTLTLWSTLMIIGAAAGGTSALQPLKTRSIESTAVPATDQFIFQTVKSVKDVNEKIANATENNQWTIIDFYADWCVNCHVIERDVFGNSDVARRLSTFNILRPDVTLNDSLDKALMREWGVLGPPTIIFIGPDGKERRAQRIVGLVSAREFINQLDNAQTP